MINFLSQAPAYLQLLPPVSEIAVDVNDFLTRLARRMGMLKKRGEVDIGRAAVFFVRWWREEGGLLAAKAAFNQISSMTNSLKTVGAPDMAPTDSGVGGLMTHSLPRAEGWGFDLQWDLKAEDLEKRAKEPKVFLQERMEACIDEHLEMLAREEREEKNVSPTQIKKKMVMEEKMRRKMKRMTK